MANEKLVHHNATQFRKGVVQLCPGFFTAVGFAASTQHMVVADYWPQHRRMHRATILGDRPV